MSFASGELTAADIAAVTGNQNSGFLGNNDGGFWLLILFLFAMMGGWGNGNQNPANVASAAAIPAVQAGFDQSAIMNALSGIQAGIVASDANMVNQMNTIAMAQQNCCCENRAATADLKYTVATEACADRNAVSNGIRDIIENNTLNTQAIQNSINAGFQAVQDKLCQQEIDALKAANANLQTQINLANLQASQADQTAKMLADNAAQTVALEQYLNPVPKPAYIVQNPNGCGSFAGCGCVA